MPQELEGTQPQQLAQAAQRDIPQGLASRSAIKMGHLARVAADVWGLAGHQLAGGERLHCAPLVSFILLLFLFPFLLNCPYFNPKVLALLPFSNSLSYPSGSGGTSTRLYGVTQQAAKHHNNNQNL